MAVLHLILQGHPAARSIPELASVRNRSRGESQMQAYHAIVDRLGIRVALPLLHTVGAIIANVSADVSSAISLTNASHGREEPLCGTKYGPH